MIIKEGCVFKIKIYIVIFTLLVSGCSIIENIAGVGFDSEQFEKAREMKVLELQYQNAKKLEKILQSNFTLFESDLTLILDENMLNKLLDQYETATGMLDESTDYLIKDVKAKVNNGSAIATLELSAHNNKHNVDVNLNMDCLILIVQDKQDLLLQIEPFNIAPTTITRGFYSAVKETINKIIKLNLSNLNKNLPPLKIPLNVQNNLIISGSKNEIKSKLNLTINNPERKIKYNFKIVDIIFFQGRIVIGMNLDKIEVES